MKKFLLSILTIIYLMVSSGIAMEIHYCMGKKAGVDFYASENTHCSHCGMKEKKGGCCTDEHKFYKLATAHKNVSNEYSAAISPVILLNNFISLSNSFLPTAVLPAQQKYDPPIYSGPPIFIMNAVFRV